MSIKRCSAEEALRFFDASPEILGILQVDGSVRRVNPAWERWLNYTKTETDERSFFSFIHPDSLEVSVKRFENLLAEGGEVCFTNQYQAHDGSYRWVSWNMACSAGEPFIYASGRDVTVYVAADDELHQKSEVLSAVLQAAPIAIWACDLEDKVRFWNAGAESIFGWCEEDVLNLIPPPIADEGLSLRSSKGQAVMGKECRGTRKDGSMVDVEVWAVPLYDRNRAPCGGLGMCVDVTEKKRREEQLRRAARAEGLAELATGIGRDFSNLLTVVSG